MFGKTVGSLQENIVTREFEIAGTLRHVTGYTGSSSNTSKQKGNYFALKADTNSGDVVATIELVGGTKGPVMLDDDVNIVPPIRDKDTQSIKVTVNSGENLTMKTYGLIRLTLETEWRRKFKMTRFFGEIGYAIPKDVHLGVQDGEITEREYFDDLIRSTSRYQTSDKLNDDINISGEISIAADPFTYQNFHATWYVELMGAKWKIPSVEVQYLRLILMIGGVYND